MIRNYYALPALVLTMSLFIGSATASVADSTSSTGVSSQAVFSPRDYCRSTGGEVSETGQGHIYLCCYPGKPQCTASDTQQTISWRVPALTIKTYSEKAQ